MVAVPDIRDTGWWLPRIAVASGAITVIGALWRPLARRWKKDFDDSVLQSLRRCKVDVRVILREDILVKDVAKFEEIAFTVGVNADRLDAAEAMIKAQATALSDIASLRSLPDAIEKLADTMVAIQREVAEIRGELRHVTWDGRERRNK